MDAKLQVGIVGCGGIAQVIHLPILSNHPDVRVAGICDIDASKAAVLADKFRINHIYQDIAELLQKEKLDVMFILTPTNLNSFGSQTYSKESTGDRKSCYGGDAKSFSKRCRSIKKIPG